MGIKIISWIFPKDSHCWDIYMNVLKYHFSAMQLKIYVLLFIVIIYNWISAWKFGNKYELLLHFTKIEAEFGKILYFRKALSIEFYFCPLCLSDLFLSFFLLFGEKRISDLFALKLIFLKIFFTKLCYICQKRQQSI